MHWYCFRFVHLADSEPKDIEFTVTTLNTKPVQSCSGPTSDGPTAVIRSGLQRLTSIRKQQMRLPSSIHGRPASGNQQQNSPVSPPPSSEKQNATTNATTTTFDANNSINNTPAAMMTTNNDKTLHLQQPRKAKSPKCVKPPKCSLIWETETELKSNTNKKMNKIVLHPLTIYRCFYQLF